MEALYALSSPPVVSFNGVRVQGTFGVSRGRVSWISKGSRVWGRSCKVAFVGVRWVLVGDNFTFL